MQAEEPYSDIVRRLAPVYKPAAPGGWTSQLITKEDREFSGMLAKTKTYRPSEKEPFMNERQRDYFRLKLLTWREDILKEAKETLLHLQEENQNHPDIADRASSETDRAIELRARDRQRKLIAKIDEALSRIDDGTYGYCEETGDPIALRRLEARPIATLSVEAQERHERRERVYRDD
jgi:DnaK suppressor protein